MAEESESSSFLLVVVDVVAVGAFGCASPSLLFLHLMLYHGGIREPH
jgi:hypothetical protein